MVDTAKAMKELTFEWQAVGELVASDDADGNAVDNLLTGSNENNLFRGKGGMMSLMVLVEMTRISS